MSESNVAMLQHEDDLDPGGSWFKNPHDFAWCRPHASVVHAHPFVTVTGIVDSIKTALRLELGRLGHIGNEIEGELDATSDGDFSGFLGLDGQAPLMEAKCQGHVLDQSLHDVRLDAWKDCVHHLSVFYCFARADHLDKVAEQQDDACDSSLHTCEQTGRKGLSITHSISRQLLHDWLTVAS